jgi:hypothetical protein
MMTDHCTHCTPTVGPLYQEFRYSALSPPRRLITKRESVVVVSKCSSRTVPSTVGLCRDDGFQRTYLRISFLFPLYMTDSGYSGHVPMTRSSHIVLNDEQKAQKPSSTVSEFGYSGGTVVDYLVQWSCR